MPFSQLLPQQAGMGGEAHLPELEQQHRQAGGFQDYDSQMSFIVKKTWPLSAGGGRSSLWTTLNRLRMGCKSSPENTLYENMSDITALMAKYYYCHK